MIFPKRVLNDLLYYKFFWVGGPNRSGKGTLALDIFHYFGDAGYRFISNTHCIWNDNPDDCTIDPNGQFNMFIQEDENGNWMRTKESIREIQTAKGKLNLVFLATSTEAPHEDLWLYRIEPVGKFNPWLRFWRVIIFNPQGKDTRYYFAQIFPRAFFGLYSTSYHMFNPESILSWVRKAMAQHSQYHAQRLGFEHESFEISDVATGRKGLGESQSYSDFQMASKALEGNRKLQSALIKNSRDRRR